MHALSLSEPLLPVHAHAGMRHLLLEELAVVSGGADPEMPSYKATDLECSTTVTGGTGGLNVSVTCTSQDVQNANDWAVYLAWDATQDIIAAGIATAEEGINWAQGWMIDFWEWWDMQWGGGGC